MITKWKSQLFMSINLTQNGLSLNFGESKNQKFTEGGDWQYIYMYIIIYIMHSCKFAFPYCKRRKAGRGLGTRLTPNIHQVYSPAHKVINGMCAWTVNADRPHCSLLPRPHPLILEKHKHHKLILRWLNFQCFCIREPGNTVRPIPLFGRSEHRSWLIA